jgi:hypothetical protein
METDAEAHKSSAILLSSVLRWSDTLRLAHERLLIRRAAILKIATDAKTAPAPKLER